MIVMIGWTGLVPWELEFSFPGSLTFTFLIRPIYILCTTHSNLKGYLSHKKTPTP